MDRSSFRFAGSTNDLEKRLAFKANLVSKIEPPKPKEPPAIDNTFNGVSPGGILVHPSLGEGTLIEVDRNNNEVLIDFGSKGLVGLVLTQAKSFVHAPIKEDTRISDDPFFGSEIQSRLLAPQDRDFREVDFSKVISPDFVDFEKSFLPIGSPVSHPSLGDGVLVEIDQDKNEVAIDFGDRGIITLVLSQIKSFLSIPRKESKIIEDPFLGDKIQRDGPIKPDSVQRDLDFSKVTSPDFMDSEISFLEPGTKVLHKDLGECTIISLDKKTNEIVLESKKHGPINLVLSQVRSTITPVEAVRKESKIIEDPFLGEKIQRDGPIKLDSVQRDLDFSKVISPDFVDSEISFLEPGTKVLHKDLGECTIVSLDKKSNEIVLDSNKHGLINLVLSQVRSTITPVEAVRKESKIIEDPFLGDKIQRDGPVKLDSVQRDLDFSKVISPDFVVPEKSFFPEGCSVWHPDLGVCTVLSVDEKSNNITLSTSSAAVIDMVLSQVRSKLRAIENTPEHVPMKPLVREKLASQVPQYKSRGDVSVRLPEAFKLWQRSQQFMFLTRSQSLTTEQTNDVFAVLDGNKPMFHNVVVAWQSKEETEANIIPGPKALSTVVDGVKVYPNILENKNLWHPDFGECSVVSVDEKGNLLILQTSVGQVPCVMDATLPSLAVITASAPEHAPKRLGTRVLVTSDTTVTERPKVVVDLPEAFVNWRVLDQYQFLTVSRHLAPEQANAIIDTMTGKLHSSPTEYEIHWTDELPESNKRAEFKDQLLKRIEAASVEQELPAPPAPVDSGTKRLVKEKTITKKKSVSKVSVDLPLDFKKWTSSGQYVFLTRSRHLTFNEANDVMDILQGKPLISSTQYEVNWHDIEPVAYAADSSVRRTTEEVDIIEKESVLKKVAVTLPADFKNWSDSKQYSFLTRARQLTINEANNVLNTFKAKPFNSEIDYEIIWSE
jgi:uncharacterized protein YuzE